MQPPDACPIVNKFGEIVRAGRADLPVIATYDFYYPRKAEQIFLYTLRELGVRLMVPMVRKGKWYGTKHVSVRLQASEEVLKCMEQRLDEIHVTANRDGTAVA
jgi:hypothetical protein